jgi:hypothetical protein
VRTISDNLAHSLSLSMSLDSIFSIRFNDIVVSSSYKLKNITMSNIHADG